MMGRAILPGLDSVVGGVGRVVGRSSGAMSGAVDRMALGAYGMAGGIDAVMGGARPAARRMRGAAGPLARGAYHLGKRGAKIGAVGGAGYLGYRGYQHYGRSSGTDGLQGRSSGGRT